MIAASPLTPMIVVFKSNKLIADVNEPVLFEFEADSVWQADIVAFYVDFHDGTPYQELGPAEIDITHSFQYEGKYLISLTAVSFAGLTDVKTCEVEIMNAPPIFDIKMVSFAYEDEIVNLSTYELLESEIDLESVKYNWDFGDGTYLTTENVSKKWIEAGTYPVTLTVFDDQNAFNSTTKFIDINNVAPKANFIIEPLKCDCPFIIEITEDEAFIFESCPLYFNASYSNDTESDLGSLQYYWDFGDGQTGWGLGIVHQYIQSGEYDVSLTVRDDDGTIDVIHKTVYVINEAPTIDLIEEFITINEGETFVFEVDSSDSFPDSPLLNYSWSFGDSGWRVSNLWTDDFIGDVNVSVEDPEGLSATDGTKITVENVPPHINLNWAYIDVNVTAFIKAPTPKVCNFSVEFIGDGETEVGYLVGKPSGENRMETPPIPFRFDLSKDYVIKINRTHELLPGVYYIDLVFSFLDGSSFSIGTSFSEFWPGWKLDPDEFTARLADHMYKMPITFEGSIFDPSKDDIHVEADFKLHLLLEIDFPGAADISYPYTKTLTIPHDPNHILYEAYVYNESGKIYSDLTFTQKLAIDDYYENEFPTNIPIKFTFYPIDLSFLEMHQQINIDGAQVINIIEAVNILEVYAEDDDGGQDSKTVKIDTTQGTTDFINFAPDAFIYAYGSSYEDEIVPMFADLFDFDNDATLNVEWNFGDGSPMETASGDAEIFHTYENEGVYLITITASDGDATSKTGTLIEIFNRVPEITLKNIYPNILEDQYVRLNESSSFSDSDSDLDELRFYWDFGDGYTYYDLDFIPFWGEQCDSSLRGHVWAESGFYNLTLFVFDDNGVFNSTMIIMNVTNEPPLIEGPYGFEGLEGTVINLDMAVFDSIADEWGLDFIWDVNGEILYGNKPSICLNDGDYTGNLTVSDMDGDTTTIDLDFIIEGITPTVTTSSKYIYGPPGEISLNAYTLDSFMDSSNIFYNWTFNGTTSITEHSSTINFKYEISSTYKCIVEAYDDVGKRGMAQFEIVVVLDSDGDGITDEIEAMLGTSPDDSDCDGDLLTDWYEEYIYGTDPLNADTDADGLPDGYKYGIKGEFYYGTDPLSNDTDNDNLTDSCEIFGWELTIDYYEDPVNYPDVYVTKIFAVDSDPLKFDTDFDGVSDYSEYVNGTDPRNKDSDNDGVDDLEDLYPWKVDADGDGLSDSKEREIGTDPNKKDSDEDGLSDSEEVYPGQDGYITLPLVADSDGDLLLDGQEVYSVTKEIKERKKLSTGWNTFILSTERTKRIIQAGLTTSISVGEGVNTVDLTIQLFLQSELLFEKQASNQRYYVNVSDIKQIVENSGKTFGGEWKLKIHSSMDCLLEEYALAFTKYLNPRAADTDNDGILDGVEVNPEENNGWITNPAKRDTDGDTINDKYEIDMGWNPNSRDTDGDGVEDWADADPLHNLIVMVRVNTAKYDDIFQIFNPTLQVTLEVEADPEHKWEVATPTEVASDGNRPIIVYLPWIYWYCWTSCITIPWLDCYWIKKCASTWLGKICWWALRCRWRSYTICTRFCVPYPGLKPFTIGSVNTIAKFDDEYYFDVDDGDTDISIKAELWKFYLLGWLPHVDGVINHDFMKDGEMNTQEKFIYSGSNFINISIETKGIPRVNTVAVYENGTFYNGHYSAIEKMTVVLLDVNSGTNDYFVAGINAILIPTSVFTNSKLHRIIETSVDEFGIVSDSKWYDVPSCIKGANVSGINREELKDSISPNVECVIAKTLNAEDAYDLLLLAVTSANETEGIIYGYTNDYVAESLGVASDILELIPLNMGDLQNSEVGVWPRTPWQNFIQIIVEIIQFIIDVLVAIGEFFVALFEWIMEIGMNLMEAITQTILAAVEAILKAVILVFIYLMFALLLILMIPMILILLPAVLLLSNILGIEPQISINSITAQNDYFNFYFGYSIGLDYVSFLDLYIPSLTFSIICNDLSFEVSSNFFKTDTDSMEDTVIDIITFETNEDPNPESSDYEQTGETPKTSLLIQPPSGLDIVEYPQGFDFESFSSGVLLAFDLIAIGMNVDALSAFAMKPATPQNKLAMRLIRVAIAFSVIALICGFLTAIFDTPQTDPDSYFFGLAVGSFIVAGMLFISSLIFGGLSGKIPKQIENLIAFFFVGGLVLDLIGPLLGIIGTDINNINPLEFFGDIGASLGIVGIVTGVIAIVLNPDLDERSSQLDLWYKVSFFLGMIGIFIWRILMIYNQP